MKYDENSQNIDESKHSYHVCKALSMSIVVVFIMIHKLLLLRGDYHSCFKILDYLHQLIHSPRVDISTLFYKKLLESVEKEDFLS